MKFSALGLTIGKGPNISYFKERKKRKTEESLLFKKAENQKKVFAI